MRFEFSPSVPPEVRERLRPWLADWVERRDFPHYNLHIPNVGRVTFRRTPWPFNSKAMTTVGVDREEDETLLRKWVGVC